MTQQPLGRWKKVLLGLSFLWLIGAAASVVAVWPNGPESPLQWLLLLSFGPPLYFLGEFFISRVLRRIGIGYKA